MPVWIWTYDLSLRVITFSHSEANAGHDVTEPHEDWRVPRMLEPEAIWFGIGQAYIIILESSVRDVHFRGVNGKVLTSYVQTDQSLRDIQSCKTRKQCCLLL